MAELADALDSGSNFRKEVEVQILLPAPSVMVYKSFLIDHHFFFFLFIFSTFLSFFLHIISPFRGIFATFRAIS